MELNLPDSIQTAIFLTGTWEPAITSLVSSALKPGHIFVDIGANIGYYTLLASKLVGEEGKVYAFEASPSIFRQLENNTRRNNAVNVQLKNVAVSNGPGFVSIWTAPQGNLGHSTIIDRVAQAEGHSLEAQVRSDRLPSSMPINDLLQARLIKMDIEGAERLAIEGLLSHLTDFTPQTEWLIELSPAFAPKGKEDTDWIFQAFLSAGYRAFRIDNVYNLPLAEDAHPSNKLTEMLAPPSDRLSDILFSKQLVV
jgi:FkbM family methyltransferase